MKTLNVEGEGFEHPSDATDIGAVEVGARPCRRQHRRRGLRRLLVRKHRLTLRLSAVIEDPAGNQRTLAKNVKPRLKIHRRR